MVVDLLAGKARFKNLIVEIDSMIRSQFMIWLDEKLAEYKVQGDMNLEINAEPPRWIREYSVSVIASGTHMPSRMEARTTHSTVQSHTPNALSNRRNREANSVSRNSCFQKRRSLDVSHSIDNFKKFKEEPLNDDDDDIFIMDSSLNDASNIHLDSSADTCTPSPHRSSQSEQISSSGSSTGLQVKHSGGLSSSPNLSSAGQSSRVHSYGVSASHLDCDDKDIPEKTDCKIDDGIMSGPDDVSDVSRNSNNNKSFLAETGGSSDYLSMADMTGTEYDELSPETSTGLFSITDRQDVCQTDEMGLQHIQSPGILYANFSHLNTDVPDKYIKFKNRRVSECDFDMEQCDNLPVSSLLGSAHKQQTITDSVSCDLCDKLFKSKQALHWHTKFHHNKFKYICSVCGVQMTNKSHLEGHINKHHLKQKPFQCDYCQKQFYDRNIMSDHKKLCIGESEWAT